MAEWATPSRRYLQQERGHDNDGSKCSDSWKGDTAATLAQGAVQRAVRTAPQQASRPRVPRFRGQRQGGSGTPGEQGATLHDPGTQAGKIKVCV